MSTTNTEKDYNGFTQAQRLAIIAQCKEITESEQEEIFRDAVNSTEEPVKVCGMTYEPARVLEEVDPTAFRVCVSDYFATEEYVEVYEGEEGGLYRAEEAQEVADSIQ